MSCISGEGPFTPSSVRVCVMSHEPYPGAALLDQLAGPIPWPIIGARILQFNPTLSMEPRVGSVGGVAMTSIRDPIGGAIALDLDVRNPWTSVLHLVARLRGFVDYRLAQYASLWKEVFSSQTFDDWPHLFAPCIHFADQTLYQQASITAGQAGLHVLHQWPFYADGTVMYHQGGYVERGWDRFYHGPTTKECCANCSNNAWFNLTGLATGMSTFSMRNWKHYCQCGGALEQLRSDMLSRIGLLYNQPTPIGWPRHLLQDQGFWTLVLAEERLSPQVMDGLWGLLLDGGLPKLLGAGDPGTLLSAGMLMAHGGQVLGRNLYEVLVERLTSTTNPLPGYGVAVTDIVNQLEASAQIVYDAYGIPGTGYPQIPFSDVSRAAGSTAWINTLNATTFRASLSPTFLNWAGGVHIDPPDVVPPGTEPPSIVEFPLPGEEPPLVPPPPGPPESPAPGARGPADRSAWVGPLVVGSSVLIGSALVIHAIRLRRRRMVQQIVPETKLVMPEASTSSRAQTRKRGSRKRRSGR